MVVILFAIYIISVISLLLGIGLVLGYLRIFNHFQYRKAYLEFIQEGQCLDNNKTLIVYEFYGVDVISMYSAIWPVTVCLFIYSLIKYGIYYLDDKKNLMFMLTHPDPKVRWRADQIKLYGKKLILMNSSLKLFEEVSIVKRTQKYKETSFRCVDR